MSMAGEAIGIDLGTTYSRVGVWQHNRVEIITNDEGNRTTPSCVAFTNTDCLVGDAAKIQAVLDPVNTIFDTKRLIGRRFSDSTVQRDMELWPFKVVSGNADRPQVLVKYEGAEKGYSPEELSAMVLMNMKRTAEKYLRKKIKNAVVTVPAHFNDSQRQSTIDAATIAGLNVLRLLVEPTAAAVAYGLDKKLTSYSDEETFVLVFDLGGGTFDVSLLKIGKDNIQVLATAGDTHLGGVDFDNRLVNHFVKEFGRKYEKDITCNKNSLRRLRNGCESAKRRLSCANMARIVVDYLYEGIDFDEEISRSKFEELNMDLFERCLETVKKCLKDADVENGSIHDVVLVGGSTRIPKVQQLLQDFFDGKQLCMSINPDEAVAYGATVLAASLSGKGNQCLKDLVLLDVTPLSLGVELKGKAVDIIIRRNTIIPARRAEEYITMEDNQTSLSFPVYEGEREKSTDNNLLGEITIDGLPPAPRGEVKVIVTFDIDADGLLHVSAEFKKAGIKTNTGRLAEKEIERMIEDAKKYRAKDKKLKRKLEAMNVFEDFVYRKRSAIRAKSNLSEDARMKLEKAFEEAINWMNADSTATVDEYMERKKKLKAICNSMSVADSNIQVVEID